MDHEAINLQDRVESITSTWNPQHICTVNESHSLKVAKIKGEFIWHSHPDTDELFYCVSGGPFRLDLCTKASSPEDADRLGRDHVVELKVGDVFCVPKEMQHRPVTEVETGILIIEKVGTINTGDREGDERTVYLKESA